MIDLSYTRAALLAEIKAPDPALVPLSDLSDLRVATLDARTCVCGRERDELFARLKLMLSERFSEVPRPQLNRDLLIPLRNALGNACKHGNRSNPAKTVCVEIVLTPKGALIAVTDQGAGFDVALTLRRFQERQNYFANHGCGFRNLHQAMSTVSYSDGGRTFLLCFRPRNEPDAASSSSWAFADEPTNAPVESPTEGHPFHDSDWFQARLSAQFPKFGNHETRIESCRVYPARGRAGDDCGHRYVLRIENLHGVLGATRILTGRLHASEQAAAADIEAAIKLHDAKISKRVLIPRPVARLAGAPRLVLYEFDPWLNLWEYLAYRRSPKSLRHAAERIGQALAALHRSRIVFAGVETETIGEELSAMVARAETTLQTQPSGPDRVNRLRLCAQRLQKRTPGQRILTPIHGAFGWDCIHYGVDGRFYFYRFEHCRWSHPGLDLGGFAADLLCFTLANRDAGGYRIAHDALLSNYNSNAEQAIDEETLRSCIALALCQRLRRPNGCPQAHAGRLLDALDAALSDQRVACSSEAA